MNYSRLFFLLIPLIISGAGVFVVKTWITADVEGILMEVGIVLFSASFLSIVLWRQINRWTHQQVQTKELDDILAKLSGFRVQSSVPLRFSLSHHPVIRELQRYFVEITSRLQQHYQSSMQFAQNASHELQTPLAIIKGNIDILLQSPRLEERDIKRLGVILQNTNKLSKLSGALVLLSKIENRPFPDETKVNLGKLTEEILYNFKDLLEMQGLKVNIRKEGEVFFFMSSSIAEILLANLIQNAIRHNIKGGGIDLVIKEQKWAISNTGQPLKVPADQLFKRFERQSDSEEGLGLGLSIVRSICDRYQIKIDYAYEAEKHRLTLHFPNKKMQ